MIKMPTHHEKENINNNWKTCQFPKCNLDEYWTHYTVYMCMVLLTPFSKLKLDFLEVKMYSNAR